MIVSSMWNRVRIPITQRLGNLFHNKGEVDWYDLRIAVKDLVVNPSRQRLWAEVNR
jgi:hypothetical protein